MKTARVVVTFLVLSLLLTLVLPADSRAQGEVKRIGLVLHFRSPFTEQIAQGARDAAKDFGYEVEVVGPPTFDATAQIGMFEALIQKGMDGLAVVAYPAETWREPINKAIEAGIPVLTLNVHSPESKAPAWFGQDEFGSGKTLAQELLKYIQDKPEGEIVLGVCAPGVNVLVDRVNGFIEVMKDYPQFKLQGPFDVGVEAAKNYAGWQNQLSAYPDAIAMVGFCAPDMPNLTKLREKTGASFVAVGYDLEPAALEGIRKGYGEVTLGQNPYLQGYLPMLAFARHFKDGTPYPQGWVDTGTEVVDQSNVEEKIARENSPELTYEYYHKIICQKYMFMNAMTKPFPGTE